MLGLIFLALLCGAILPIQAGINAKMGDAVNDPIYGALISFVVGLIGLAIYAVVTKVDFATISNLRTADWTVWTGGLMGAFYVVATIILVPKIGAALTFGLIVAGQMLVSVILDHYGLLGVPIQPINWQRVLGILMLIGGFLLIRNF